MKTRIVLILILVSSLVWGVSCKKKETPPTTTSSTINASLIGTWAWTELYQLPNMNTQPSSATMITNMPSGKNLTFASNGTYSGNWYYIQMGTPLATNNDNGNYTNTDSLTMTSGVTGYSIKAKIFRLTNTELWIRYRTSSPHVYEVHFVK